MCMPRQGVTYGVKKRGQHIIFLYLMVQTFVHFHTTLHFLFLLSLLSLSRKKAWDLTLVGHTHI